MLLVEFDAFTVLHASAAENIERGTNGEIDTIAAEASDRFEVLDGVRAAGVSGGDGAPLGEIFHEFVIDAAAKAFDIDGMDQELSAMRSEALQCLRSEGDGGEFLPAIGDNKIIAVAFAAA